MSDCKKLKGDLAVQPKENIARCLSFLNIGCLTASMCTSERDVHIYTCDTAVVTSAISCSCYITIFNNGDTGAVTHGVTFLLASEVLTVRQLSNTFAPTLTKSDPFCWFSVFFFLFIYLKSTMFMKSIAGLPDSHV